MNILKDKKARVVLYKADCANVNNQIHSLKDLQIAYYNSKKVIPIIHEDKKNVVYKEHINEVYGFAELKLEGDSIVGVMNFNSRIDVKKLIRENGFYGTSRGDSKDGYISIHTFDAIYVSSDAKHLNDLQRNGKSAVERFHALISMGLYKAKTIKPWNVFSSIRLFDRSKI